MSKNILLAAVVAASLGLGMLPKAEAKDAPAGNEGPSLELSASSRRSFELAFGFEVFTDVGSDGQLMLKASLVDLWRGRTVIVPLYLGLSGFALDPGGLPNDYLDLGIRVPVGVSVDFKRTSLRVFLEAAFMAGVANFGGYRDGWFGFGGLGGIGFRF